MSIPSWRARRDAVLSCYEAVSLRRVVRLTLLLAFLVTTLHVVVDHGVGGQTPFTLLPHPCASPVPHHDDHPGTHHHAQEEDSCHGPHPADHQADTHTHFLGYPSVPVRLALHLVPTALAAHAGGLASLALGAAALCGYTAASPPRRPLLSLCSSVLRI